MSTSTLRLWSACTIPTQARIWITGIAASHWSPSTTGHEVRRQHHERRQRRHRHARQDPDHPRPGRRDPLGLVLDAAERRRHHALERPADLAGRLEDRVEGDRVGAERRRAQEAADEEAVAVRLEVVEHPVAEHEDAEAAELPQAAHARRRTGASTASAARPRWS